MDQDQKRVQQASQPPQERLSSVALPGEALREAEHYRLGLPLQRYQDQNPVGLKIFWGIWGVWTLIPVIVGVLVGRIDASTMLYIGVSGGVPLIVVLIETLRVMTQIRKRGYLCSDGFLIMTGSSRVLAAIRWDEIQEIYEEWNERERKWWVITKDNRRVTISIFVSGRVREMEKLGEQALAAFRRLHPPTLNSLIELLPAVLGLTQKRKHTM